MLQRERFAAKFDTAENELPGLQVQISIFDVFEEKNGDA